MITSDKNMLFLFMISMENMEKNSKSFAVNLGLVSLQKYIQWALLSNKMRVVIIFLYVYKNWTLGSNFHFFSLQTNLVKA